MTYCLTFRCQNNLHKKLQRRIRLLEWVLHFRINQLEGLNFRDLFNDLIQRIFNKSGSIKFWYRSVNGRALTCLHRWPGRTKSVFRQITVVKGHGPVLLTSLTTSENPIATRKRQHEERCCWDVRGTINMIYLKDVVFRIYFIGTT